MLLQHDDSTINIVLVLLLLLVVVNTLLQFFHRMCWWKRFRKSVNIWRRYGRKFAAYFLGPPCIIIKCYSDSFLAKRILFTLLVWGLIIS